MPRLILRCTCRGRSQVAIDADHYLLNRPAVLAFLIDHGPGVDHVITTHLEPAATAAPSAAAPAAPPPPGP